MGGSPVSSRGIKIGTFPTLPSIAAAVLSVTSQSKTISPALQEIIRSDPSLTTAILQTANSPYHGRMRQIGSLKDAVPVLGSSEIRSIVLSKVIFASFKKFVPGRPFDVRLLWRHSYDCALAAGIVATEAGFSPHEYFTAGLLHDIGKIAMYLKDPEAFADLFEAADNCLARTDEHEPRVMGVAHEKLGMDLVRRWLFPEKLVSAVCFHHNPDAAEREVVFPLVVCLADQLAHSGERMSAGEPLPKIGEGIFRDEIVSFSSSLRIKWDHDSVRAYLKALSVQKAQGETVMGLMH